MSFQYVSTGNLNSNLLTNRSVLRPVSSSVGSSVNNFFTGNLDYQRYLETMGLQNAFSAEQAQLARDFSSLEAEKSRNWLEQMSNSAYQRQVADMKKAGLNPYLAYSAGGASTPSGVMAQSSSAMSSQGGHFNSSRGINTLVSGLMKLGGSALNLVGTAMRM